MDYNEFSDKLSAIAAKCFYSALLFNTIVDGQTFETLSKEDLKNKIVSQYYITLEEVAETEKAIKENDIVELYDGLADCLYTAEFLFEMVDYYILKFTKDKSTDIVIANNELGVDFWGLNTRYDDVFESDFDIEILNKCVDCVLENNMQKFTTDKHEFDTWQSPYNRKERVVNGTTYHFFVDDNGKVRKRDDFHKVDLESIVLGKGSQYAY